MKRNKISKKELVRRKIERSIETARYLDRNSDFWCSRLRCGSCGHVGVYEYSEIYAVQDLTCSQCGSIGCLQEYQ